MTLKIKKMLQVSLLKTVRFNLHYFGLKGLRLPCLVSRFTKLSKLKGKVIINSPTFGCVHIGFDGVEIFDLRYERTIWGCSGTVIFGGKACLGLGTRISCAGKLEFGNNFRLTAHSSIICTDYISFGEGCLVSWNCLFMDSDLHKIYDQDGDVVNKNRPISIGNDVWVCSNCIILKGCEISDMNVIAAGTILAGQKIHKSSQVIGTHGSIIKENILWKP